MMDPFGKNDLPIIFTGKPGRPGTGRHYGRKNRNKPCAHGVAYGKECERCNTEVVE